MLRRASTKSRQIALPLPPGPPGHPLFGTLPEVWSDVLRLALRSRREYGDVVRFRSLGHTAWFTVSHPDDVEHVLHGYNQNYVKGQFIRPLKMVTGEGLFTSEGDFWRSQRRLIAPAFHRPKVAALANIITDEAQTMLDGWRAYEQNKQPFDAAAEMMQLTLHLAGRTLFGAPLREQAQGFGDALGTSITYVNYRVTHWLAPSVKVPTSRNRRFRAAIRVLDKVVQEIIEKRRREQESGGEIGRDLLSLLLQARDEDSGEGMDDRQLRDEVMTLLLAGHETTAVALAWTWYRLAQHPEVEERLHEELDHVLNGRTPVYEDLPTLPYSRMILEETMRLHPPIWGLPRQTIADDAIRGYRIPAGAPVMLFPYVTHRHPDFWENPEEYDPENFSPERSTNRPRYAYFPFGGGARLCLGNHFAMMEMQLTLAMVAQRYRLRLIAGQTMEREQMITLRPRHGVRVTIEPRA